MDSLIATFHIDWKIMLAQAINFAVVLFVLYRYALKPLKKLMDERGATIQSGLDNAKKQEALLAKQKEDYDAMLADARKEVAGMIKQGKQDAETLREDLVEKAHAEASSIILAGQKRAEADRDEMMAEVKKEAVSLVISVAEKVLGDVATGKVEAKLVEESIKNI
jgi:F-type H+-transporting ATPase subunit b